jgi:putative transcriptional regulator
MAMYAKNVQKDIDAKVLAKIKETIDGKTQVLEARTRSGLSQQRFADVLGVSRRTLEAWEQGRRKPTGAARSLLTIATRRPDVLKELFAA